MPTPIFAAGPSFIHLNTWDSPEAKLSSPSHSSPSLRIHRATATTTTTSTSSGTLVNTSNKNTNDKNTNNKNVNNNNNHDSIEHTTLFLKRFTLASDNHHRSSSSSSSSNRRRGRSGISRMRGKHGFVKALHAHSGAATTATLVNNHPFSKEARSAHFKTFMQSRRLRLRQRGGQPHFHHDQQDIRLLDSSDMSLDESEVQDEDEDNDDDEAEARDHVLDIDPEQYRHYMWELEQRLLERTESAAKSRSSFLMERRLSAGERLHHVQRVVQQQRTEQEMRQRKARHELEQKMVRAMARRNAYLEAAIENDPSRRFRRKDASSSTSQSSSVSSHKTKLSRAGSTTAPTAATATTASSASAKSSVTPSIATKKGAPPKMMSSSAVRPKLKRDSVRSKDNINSKHTTEIRGGDDEGLHGQGSPKNSPFNMTPSRKVHLTSMTSASSSSSSSSSSSLSPLTISPSQVENVQTSLTGTFQDNSKEIGVKGGVVVASCSTSDPTIAADVVRGSRSKERLERMTLWAQRRIRQRLVQKASREYMRAIGGSHQRVLGLKFEELARLLHTNKALLQATVKLLRYSSQLAQMDVPPDTRSKRMLKNPARVFLSVYMVLAHPSQIRSPSEHAHPTQVEDDSAFESLVTSSKALLEALQTWITVNTKHVDNVNLLSLPASTPPTTDAGEQPAPSPSSQDNDTTALHDFDAAWTSYYNFFEAWKDKDAQRLLKTLLDHARQIEALWETVQNDLTARAEWGPRIEEQRKDLRDKARQLAGLDGVARVDEVFAEFVSATTPAPPAITAAPTETIACSPVGTTTPTLPPVNPSTVTAPTPAPMETDTESAAPKPQPERTEPSSSSAPLEPTTPSTITSTKKRQRVLSVSNSDSAMDVDEPQTATVAGAGAGITHVASLTAAAGTVPSDDPAAASTGEEPLPKKPTRIRVPRQPMLPAGFEKQEKWSNLQLIHELALDPNFKIESQRLGSGGGSAATSDATEDTSTSNSSSGNSMESLESRIRAMATKAYFDRIREDAEQGQLGKWILPLVTTIREQLLDMVPAESSVARQIREGFDLEFVQSRVEKNVYDVKNALERVLSFMAQLCAPVRDPAIRMIQRDLSLITGNPLQQGSQSSSPADRPAASATSPSSRDLVSILKDILELLEEMLMDLANYRLMVARPSLERQAIPYEQHAFKTALENGEVSLDATAAWLEASVANISRASAVSTTTLSGAATTTTAGARAREQSKTNRHYEVYVNAVLDLLYSKTPLDMASKDEFPETFVLDQARLIRYQNELQALALISVMWNVSLNVQPPLRDKGQEELKQTLLRLMESADTSKETLAEAIIEAKEKALLLTSRPSSLSTTSSTSSPTRPTASPAPATTASLLLSDEQKAYLRNTIERAISFDSSLYSVLSQRIRKVLESYLLSSPPGGAKPGVMPSQAELNKFGLGTMAKEIETFATQIGFLIRYNAKVYQQWYDPLLTRILPESTRSPTKPRSSATPAVTATAPATVTTPATVSTSDVTESTVAADTTAPPSSAIITAPEAETTEQDKNNDNNASSAPPPA
ncbi:hypothetical protein BGW39_005001 [Mortierella sp. 14UC]|nr:hypothetical protein BGW39_005001 [Mortierella sp. 14UC]